MKSADIKKKKKMLETDVCTMTATSSGITQ